ncbi:MAG: T9SS type A sorting domain-containing protein [Bacteroidota bacterium]
MRPNKFLVTRVVTLLFFFFTTVGLIAQDVQFELDGFRLTDGGNAYAIDVMVTGSTAFKIGSGQLYFNYDTKAFGERVQANGNFTVERSQGSILATPGGFGFFYSLVVNDNTPNRVSVSFQQGGAAGCLQVDNVSTTPTLLYTIKFTFAPGQEGTVPDICFEFGEVFQDQTFTACGPFTVCGFADCTTPANRGTQLTSDRFVCQNSLPVELLAFAAVAVKEDAHLSWTTATEVGSSHFAVEKSADGQQWRTLGRLDAAGNSLVRQDYAFVDPDFTLDGPEAYYRLRMEDQDGSFTYSDIRFLEGTSSAEADFRVFPNPATDGVNVRVSEATELTLYALSGQVVRRDRFGPAVATSRFLDLRGLAPGVYVLRSSAGPARRIIKQ